MTGARTLARRWPDLFGLSVNQMQTPDVIETAWGRATRCSLAPSPTTKDVWLIYYPGFHPFWDYYALSLASLCDVEGLPPATLHYPEAEYEILLATLDPAFKPDPTDGNTLRIMRPVNYVRQINGISEAGARFVVEKLAKCVCNNRLVPELQGFAGAVDMWNSAVDELTEHFNAAPQIPSEET